MCDSIRTTTTTRRMRRYAKIHLTVRFSASGSVAAETPAPRAPLPSKCLRMEKVSAFPVAFEATAPLICRRDPHTHPAARHARAPRTPRADPRLPARHAVLTRPGAVCDPLQILCTRARVVLADRAPAAVLALVTHAFMLAYAARHSVHWYRIRLCSHTALPPQSRHFERWRLCCRYLFLRTRDSSTRSIDSRADTTGPSRSATPARATPSRAPGADPEGAEPARAPPRPPRQGGSSHPRPPARACRPGRNPRGVARRGSPRGPPAAPDARLARVPRRSRSPPARCGRERSRGPTPWGEGGR